MSETLVENLDPKAELQRLIKERTCQICDKTFDSPYALVLGWRFRTGWVCLRMCPECSLRTADAPSQTQRWPW